MFIINFKVGVVLLTIVILLIFNLYYEFNNITIVNSKKPTLKLIYYHFKEYFLIYFFYAHEVDRCHVFVENIMAIQVKV